MEIIDKFKAYIKNIKKGDKVAVFYHAFCTDGLCSCIITSKAITKITNVKPAYHIHYVNYHINDETIKFLKEKKITKAIFVDLSLDIDAEKIKEAENYSDLLIIDHHKYRTDLNSDKTVFCHSEFVRKDLDGSMYPASKLAYDLFSLIENIGELDWLAAVGLIADMGYNNWKDFVINVQDRYGLKKDENVFKTGIGKASSIIGTSKMAGQDKDNAFDVVFNANKIQDILNDKGLKKYEIECKKEIDNWLEKRDKAEKHGDLYIYEIKPKYNVGSTISTILSTDYLKDKTIIVISDKTNKELLSVSARDQRRKIKLNELLQEAIKGLPDANAGGHIPAAAAQIRKEDLDKFKKKLIELYKSLNK